MKKNKKLLAFTIFSLFSIKSFASNVKIDKKENTEKIDEDFNIVLDELEEIDKNENPDYTSKIFFSLPVALGVNYPLKNNENEKKEEFNFIGSRTLNATFYVNFPLPVPFFWVSAGAELGNSSFSWEGNRNICNVKTLADKNEELLNEMQKEAIDFTKFNFWRAGLCAKITLVTEKFDHRNGFSFSINGGLGWKFWASLEQGLKESFNGTKNTISGNDDLLGLKNFSTYMGAEVGYQRIGVFYKQFFTPVFNSEKVAEDKICSYPFCLEISFNLL
ncbi:MAG: hypothetical protein LBD32_01160 [Cytophagales bacterium]|jgi:hypothetical protein|nr:hypothetical protein [Cytophagales bacterium]